MKNVGLADAVLRSLSGQGVAEFVVCAGARNAPFVKLLGAASGARVHFFFEERAGAFFALGRARREGRPVAVVTTSGTAAAELLPAVVEAYYAGIPLVLVTADRPRAFRGSGAPQAIEQAGLFGVYARAAFDVETLSDVAALRLAAAAPTQVNVAFGEPLIDAPLPVLHLQAGCLAAEPAADPGDDERCARFLARVQRPLVVVGGLRERHRALVASALAHWGAAVHAEAPSGLREIPALQSLRVQGIEKPAQLRRHFDALIRIGDVPTLRLWRDLEDTLADLPVLSISERPFSGLAREREAPCGFGVLEAADQGPEFSLDAELQRSDAAWRAGLDALLEQWPDSEPGMIRRLSQRIPRGSLVMLGNSLPIREWDLAASREDRGFEVVCNRGANGIDGLVASFLGLAREGVENWLVLGDLSALYDLNALAFTRSAAPRLRIAVVNNGGGRIFEAMFGDKAFYNEHGFGFSHWARMFGWHHAGLDDDLPPGPSIVEILPDAAATAAFRAAHGALAKAG